MKTSVYLLILAMTFLAPSALAQEGLVGYWSFDDIQGDLAEDSSGNENHGTLVGGPEQVVGMFGGALNFDGAEQQKVTVPHSDSFATITEAVTMEAWISPANFNSWVSFGAKGVPSAYGMFVNPSAFVRMHYNRNQTPLDTAANILKVNEWTHVVGAYDGKNVRIYINGEVKAEKEATNLIPSDTSSYDIGATQTKDWFTGMIDEVKLYNRGLTEAEVLKAMQGPSVELSSNPQPEDGALYVARDVSLNWTPGELADTHTVFFGKVAENVNNASTTDPMGVLASQGQIATTYDPPGRLDFGQTYYWRVDEVNPAPDYTVFKGDLWGFTVEPFAYPIDANNIAASASSEVRADEGAENTINGSGIDDSNLHSAENSDMWLSNVADADGTWIQYEFDRIHKLHQMLAWNYNSSVEPVVGFGIKEAVIEYSVDGTDWSVLGTTHEFAQGSGSPGYAVNTTIDLDGVSARYVKITANSNWGGMVNQYGLSEVRFLSIPVLAREPEPEPGATDVDVDVTLSWRAGREAAGHDVYLSTDEQAVIDGTAPFTTVAEASYASSLDVASTYYWRIAEVNDAETPVMWQGDVWNFSTQEYIVVDDFESYNDIPVGEEGSNLVYVAWVDGFDNPSTNGSTMGYVAGASLESDNVHAGGKSVPLAYDNTTAGLSEVVRTFTPAQDWTAHGIKTLSLWFAGDGANVPGQLYVKVNGIQVNYDGDAANLTVAGWQPWNIDLAAINTNLSNVTSLTIGIQGPGATGTLLLDDIRLYSYDRELITPSDPGNAGLQAHYEFEGNTNDSSGNARHGTAMGNPFFGAGKIGQAISFDGIDDVVEVPHSAGIGFNDSTNLTVTLWAKPIKLPRLSWTGIITKNRDVGGSAAYGIWMSNSNQWHFRVDGTAGNANIPGAPEVTEDWHFVAMTHDVDATTLRGYVDGLMIYENTNSNPAPLTAQSPLWIGGAQGVTEFYPGQIDDVRIYDRTLTQEEITWLAGRTQPFDKPF